MDGRIPFYPRGAAAVQAVQAVQADPLHIHCIVFGWEEKKKETKKVDLAAQHERKQQLY